MSLTSVGWLWWPAGVAFPSAHHSVAARSAKQSSTYPRLIPTRLDQRQLSEAADADERRQRLSDIRAADDARRPRGSLSGQQHHLHPSHCRHCWSDEPMTGHHQRPLVISGQIRAMSHEPEKQRELWCTFGHFGFGIRGQYTCRLTAKN